MANCFFLLSLLLLAQPSNAALRTRHHLRGSLHGFQREFHDLISLAIPTPKPTLHPTTRQWVRNYWAGSDTSYPTSVPTAYPSYDYSSHLHTDLPTYAASSYLPTRSPAPTPHWNTEQVGHTDAGVHSGVTPNTVPVYSSAVEDDIKEVSEPSELESHEATSNTQEEQLPTATSVDSGEAKDEVNDLSPALHWVELASSEQFQESSIFHYEGATYYPYAKDRHGVVRIQHSGSSIYSNNIALYDRIPTPRQTLLKVVFSYYANSMEIHDGFCLDSSADDGITWTPERCFYAVADFENGKWYDGVSVPFELKSDAEDDVDSFRIRIRGKADSARDDILIDEVRVLQLVESRLKVKVQEIRRNIHTTADNEP